METRIINMKKLSMGEAYDFTQYSGVKNGDILIVKDGIAIMYRAWPVMIIGESDVFHMVESDSTFQDIIDSTKPESQAALQAALKLTNLPIDQLESSAIDFIELCPPVDSI